MLSDCIFSIDLSRGPLSEDFGGHKPAGAQIEVRLLTGPFSPFALGGKGGAVPLELAGLRTAPQGRWLTLTFGRCCLQGGNQLIGRGRGVTSDSVMIFAAVVVELP